MDNNFNLIKDSHDLTLAIVLSIQHYLEDLELLYSQESRDLDDMFWESVAHSYIKFYEVVSHDSLVTKQLKELNIPVDKNERNKLAHGASCDKKFVESYLRNMLSSNVSKLVLDNFYDRILDQARGYYIAGSYNSKMKVVSVEDTI